MLDLHLEEETVSKRTSQPDDIPRYGKIAEIVANCHEILRQIDENILAAEQHLEAIRALRAGATVGISANASQSHGAGQNGTDV